MALTDFEKKVLKLLKKVPRGKVITYSKLAKMAGSPRAARAVGNALHKNPDAPVVPCHRVVKSDGALGGYAGGWRRKTKLLREEGVVVKNGKIVDFKKIAV
ncbi:MAG TPA: MGMT family protein [Candidatus Moranbacteria bacterium]|nr:MGMT family protein [Candidatus Moranbacteria bacterium]